MNDAVDDENKKDYPPKIMQEARDALTEAKATLANIKNYEKELLIDTEERESIQTKISSLESNISEIFSTAETNNDKTSSFYTELLGTEEAPDDSIVNKIKNAETDVFQILKDTKEIKESLESANIKVNGYINEENEEENVIGLIEKVNKLIKTNADFHADQIKDNETMVERINNQLSGATTVSLAKAYEDQQKKYILPNILWSLVFLASMTVMIGFAIDTFNHFNFDGATDAFIKIVSRSPIFLPLIWIGIFSSKQQSQNKRLQQEYAHKAAIAKSFEGYKEQIQQLIKQDEDGEITKKLLNNVIDAIKINPSDTLESKSHTDGSPMKTPNVGSAIK